MSKEMLFIGKSCYWVERCPHFRSGSEKGVLLCTLPPVPYLLYTTATDCFPGMSNLNMHGYFLSCLMMYCALQIPKIIPVLASISFHCCDRNTQLKWKCYRHNVNLNRATRLYAHVASMCTSNMFCTVSWL